jgi:hypothetical protein
MHRGCNRCSRPRMSSLIAPGQIRYFRRRGRQVTRKGESRIEQRVTLPLAYQRDAVQGVMRSRAGHAHRESVQRSRCSTALQGNVCPSAALHAVSGLFAAFRFRVARERGGGFDACLHFGSSRVASTRSERGSRSYLVKQVHGPQWLSLTTVNISPEAAKNSHQSQQERQPCCASGKRWLNEVVANERHGAAETKESRRR